MIQKKHGFGIYVYMTQSALALFLSFIVPESLDDDGYLLIASQSIVQQVSLDGQRSRVIASILNNSAALAVDYDFK